MSGRSRSEACVRDRHMDQCHCNPLLVIRKELVNALGRGVKKSEATYLFGVSISSVKGYVRAWSIPSSAQGKHD